MRSPIPATRTKLLASVPLFQGCTARQLAEINDVIDDMDVSAGDVMMREEERTKQSYIVVAGEAVVSRRGIEIARVGPGEFFGEMPFGDASSGWRGTVVALTPMRLLVLQPAGCQLLVDIPTLSERLVHLR